MPMFQKNEYNKYIIAFLFEEINFFILLNENFVGDDEKPPSEHLIQP